MEEGGDWERRNRLKVYRGIYALTVRDFDKAAQLLLDTVSTFTCTELLTYKHFIGLTVLVSLISLDRPTLKEKVRSFTHTLTHSHSLTVSHDVCQVVDGPEIQECLHELKLHKTFLLSLYNCNYADFFAALRRNHNLATTRRLAYSLLSTHNSP